MNMDRVLDWVYFTKYNNDIVIRFKNSYLIYIYILKLQWMKIICYLGIALKDTKKKEGIDE